MVQRKSTDQHPLAKQGTAAMSEMPAKLATATFARAFAARDVWRLLIILFGAFALVLALTTAATHQHKTALDTKECAICSDVIDKVVGLPLLPAIVQHVYVMPYRVLAVSVKIANYCSPELFPPSCGPPHASA
ncbi:hypothetical protein QN372_02340 [Undibacterium sp. RTI2.1]|uniref:hypothetical protein n=1 Tax=unclassified Undibacterium TaxID=2630295 RepID=UPI002AB51DC5|nr:MULTISPECIES: hypothetical protein [unclassified Undibacterium]MDY7536756.1 hypothetical protein [Undibacterium sp. 5I1]MEB0029578.1 hypothetical protein [Undibacterium sp. RTI2.1]MEB0115765.1 hypothetical protein [Undibacterium sp. RTI2.2]MEB0231910.1 hypothetical protein [Undibacterium sp. 10I3]MEB0256638.1 hypothetical protein [Undibacterium sp. 5I1]